MSVYKARQRNAQVRPGFAREAVEAMSRALAG